MKHIALFAVVLAAVIMIPGNNVYPAGSDLSLAVELLKKNHVSGLVFDDQVIEEIKYDFLDNLDGDGLFFLQPDREDLFSIKVTESELLRSENIFYQKAVRKYRERLDETIRMISEQCRNKPDYTASENVIIQKRGDSVFSSDNNSKKVRWGRIVKFGIMSKTFSQYYEEKSSLPFPEYLDSHESAVRTEIEKRYIRKIKNILNNRDGYERFLRQIYLNSIVMRFDPHSMVFSSKIMKRMADELSSQTKSFGFSFDKDRQGNIVIERIIPGGSAWKTGSLSKGDVVLSAAVPGAKAKDLSEYSLEDMYDVINAKSDVMIFKVRKKNGTIVFCKLVKTKMSGDNKIMTSYVLNGGKKVGYICLPSFYTDWDTPGQLGCANDVAKEIIKLQKDGIEGLILDLRDNGGGSVVEALNLAGLFIDEGAMLIADSGKNGSFVLKDLSRGTLYDGPLVVMVNGQSASATEMTASILKEYNRAVIVGSQTFGKGSMQSVFPLVRGAKMDSANPYSKTGDSDYIKITGSLVYNTGGDSFQKKGVTPHVLLPEIVDFISDQEKSQKHSLASSKLIKCVAIEKLPGIDTDYLASESRSRVSRSSRFDSIRNINKERAGLSSMSFSLNVEKFPAEYFKIYFSESEEYKNVFVKTDKFTAVLNSGDSELVQLDSFMKEISAEKLKQIGGDICVEEAYKITVDYIKNIK